MGVHNELFDELVEWFEDVEGVDGRPGVGARCVVVAVPVRWGRTTVLGRLADHVSAQVDRQALAILVDGSDAPDGLKLQAVWLPDAANMAAQSDIADVLGVATPSGLFTRSLGTADAVGLLGGRAGSVAALVVALGIDALGHRDARQRAHHLAGVERFGRRMTRFSRDQFALVVVVDDAEFFEPELLDRFVTALIEPLDSRVLVVVACDPTHPRPFGCFGPVGSARPADGCCGSTSTRRWRPTSVLFSVANSVRDGPLRLSNGLSNGRSRLPTFSR